MTRKSVASATLLAASLLAAMVWFTTADAGEHKIVQASFQDLGSGSYTYTISAVEPLDMIFIDVGIGHDTTLVISAPGYWNVVNREAINGEPIDVTVFILSWHDIPEAQGPPAHAISTWTIPFSVAGEGSFWFVDEETLDWWQGKASPSRQAMETRYTYVMGLIGEPPTVARPCIGNVYNHCIPTRAGGYTECGMFIAHCDGFWEILPPPVMTAQTPSDVLPTTQDAWSRVKERYREDD